MLHKKKYNIEGLPHRCAQMATIVLSRYAEKHKSWVFFLTLVWQAKLMPCICRPDIALSIQIAFSLMCSLVYIKNSTKASGITRKLNRSHIDDNGSSDYGIEFHGKIP